MSLQVEEEKNPQAMKATYEELLREIKDAMVGATKTPGEALQARLYFIIDVYSVRKFSLHLILGRRLIKWSKKEDLKLLVKLKNDKKLSVQF